MTEEARKRTGSAKDTAQGAKEYAQQTVDAGSDYIKDTQQQGESAWQKVKDRVTETVDKVTSAPIILPSSAANSTPHGHIEHAWLNCYKPDAHCTAQTTLMHRKLSYGQKMMFVESHPYCRASFKTA